MPRLSCDLVEHRLPMVEDFKPFKQPLHRMSVEVKLQVKEEIVRLVKAKFNLFVANSAGKVEPFSSLLKLKDEEKFRWEETHYRAFDPVKEYLAKPPMLIPPTRG
ncbi:hypothetical protein L3X38_037597 [Prunus dulcis]|uniref:Uncharacterized protein n=1 Tax=Prunus dulcis TaxID=3755 RepID=A0AAD4YQS6_PRUDU|nr:hypothetical protein L3X38_037597 [Prunus dulcis]